MPPTADVCRWLPLLLSAVVSGLLVTAAVESGPERAHLGDQYYQERDRKTDCSPGPPAGCLLTAGRDDQYHVDHSAARGPHGKSDVLGDPVVKRNGAEVDRYPPPVAKRRHRRGRRRPFPAPGGCR